MLGSTLGLSCFLQRALDLSTSAALLVFLFLKVKGADRYVGYGSLVIFIMYAKIMKKHTNISLMHTVLQNILLAKII